MTEKEETDKRPKTFEFWARRRTGLVDTTRQLREARAEQARLFEELSAALAHEYVKSIVELLNRHRAVNAAEYKLRYLGKEPPQPGTGSRCPRPRARPMAPVDRQSWEMTVYEEKLQADPWFQPATPYLAFWELYPVGDNTDHRSRYLLADADGEICLIKAGSGRCYPLPPDKAELLKLLGIRLFETIEEKVQHFHKTRRAFYLSDATQPSEVVWLPNGYEGSHEEWFTAHGIGIESTVRGYLRGTDNVAYVYQGRDFRVPDCLRELSEPELLNWSKSLRIPLDIVYAGLRVGAIGAKWPPILRIYPFVEQMPEA